MNTLLKTALILLMATLGAASAFANEADIKELKAALSKRSPNAIINGVKASPIAGLYEVLAPGQVIYMTKDARYIFDGDVYDVQT